MSTDDEIKEKHLKRIAEMQERPDFDFEEIKREAKAEATPEPNLPDRDYAEFVCEAANCYQIATEEIKVKAGKFGIVTLYVCPNCVGKFTD